MGTNVPVITSLFLGFFIWPDSLPDGAEYVLLLFLPFALFVPAMWIIHLATMLFLWIWGIKRFRRKKYRSDLDGWILAGWIIGSYILTTTATNLLLFLFTE